MGRPNKKIISSSITLVAHDFFQFLKFFSSSSKFPNQKSFYWKQFSNKRLVFIWRMCSWMFVKWHIPNVTNVTFQMSQMWHFSSNVTCRTSHSISQRRCINRCSLLFANASTLCKQKQVLHENHFQKLLWLLARLWYTCMYMQRNIF